MSGMSYNILDYNTLEKKEKAKFNEYNNGLKKFNNNFKK